MRDVSAGEYALVLVVGFLSGVIVQGRIGGMEWDVVVKGFNLGVGIILGFAVGGLVITAVGFVILCVCGFLADFFSERSYKPPF